MYPGYNSQKVLQEERVNDLLAHARPYETKQRHLALRLLAFLRHQLTALSERTTPRHAISQDQRECV